MALANEILAPRFNRALAQLLAMKEGAPAPQLSPDIQAILDITGPTHELQRMLGVIPWSAYTAYGPHAAEFSMVGILNPTGSRILSVIEHIVWRPGGVQVLRALLVPPPTTWSALGICQPRDTSVYPLERPQTQVCMLHQGATPGSLLQEVYIGYSFDQTFPFVLGPGYALLIQNANTNTAVWLDAWGYERVQETSEAK